MAKEIDNQENLTLKKIRYYQGSIKDYETFWNDKISQSESEISPETKNLASHNADLNKAFEIIPVTADAENVAPEPLTNDEKKDIEGEKECKCKKGEKCKCKKGEKCDCDDKDCDCKKDDKDDKKDKKKKVDD